MEMEMELGVGNWELVCRQVLAVIRLIDRRRMLARLWRRKMFLCAFYELPQKRWRWRSRWWWRRRSTCTSYSNNNYRNNHKHIYLAERFCNIWASHEEFDARKIKNEKHPKIYRNERWFLVSYFLCLSRSSFYILYLYFSLSLYRFLLFCTVWFVPSAFYCRPLHSR